MRWIMTNTNISLLYGANRDLAQHFFGRESFSVSNDPVRTAVPSGIGAVPVLRYTSYSHFSADLQDGSINSAYRWVMYDPEQWNATPLEEQKYPLTYLQMFGQRAHASGYRALMQPARNLALEALDVKRGSQESLDSWYLRAKIPETSARTAEALLIQSQVHQTDMGDWANLLANGQLNAKKANGFAFVCGGLSTARGNADSMFTAAKEVVVDGFYVTMGEGTLNVATGFFSEMQKAGY